MDLKQRLAQLDKLTRKPAEGSARIGFAKRPHVGVVEDVLAGLGLQREETSAGPVWWIESADPVAPPGTPRLPDLTGFFTREADGRPAAADLLFLDTETTGLAGGTGTFVFLLGVSWWSGADLQTRQYFLPGPGHEVAMLAQLAELAGDFKYLATFNGASFDLPLLRTRALLNRLADPVAHLIGWDLLVPARRLWGQRLPDCRQQTLEKHICGRERGEGDIEGSRIPQTWFDFLATGEAGELANVVTHNRRDMVGMALIFAQICRQARDLGAPRPTPSTPVDAGTGRAHCWALARICERRQIPAAAGAYFARAWAEQWGVVTEPALRRRFRRDAIRNLKRCHRWDLLEELIADGLESDPGDVVLHREAAILYEHRLVDLDRALWHARQAGDEHRAIRLRRRGAAERDTDEADAS